jgi:hypothetical protein
VEFARMQAKNQETQVKGCVNQKTFFLDLDYGLHICVCLLQLSSPQLASLSEGHGTRTRLAIALRSKTLNLHLSSTT